jgi:hypothetical protein
MKCSECNYILRPVVSVDIDGTMGNYHDHFRVFAEQYLGQMLPWDYRGGKEFSDYLFLDKEVYRQIKLAYRQGGMKRSMDVYHGATNFMKWLYNQDVEIWISTTRPWMRLDNIDPDTRHWLERNDIKWDYMIYGDDKYKQLLDRVENPRIVAVVDDLFEECERAESALDGGSFLEVQSRVFQPKRPHNRDESWQLQFDDFEQLSRVLRDNLADWRSNSGW